MPSTKPLIMTAAGVTDLGRQRSRNEDSYALSIEAGLAVVCDGMGGHAGGDVASRTAAAIIVNVIADGDGTMPPPVRGNADDADRTLSGPAATDPLAQAAASLVRHAVVQANARLITMNQERGYPDGRGMGTTVVGLWRVEGTDTIVVFHAGDSRLYRLRAGTLVQLTRDHSLYQVWLDGGGQGQAPQRNIIVRALGTSANTEPDVAVHTVAAGDLYLLCTDGLTGLIEDQELAGMLAADGDLDPAARQLIALANERGGNDNITVILTRFD